MTNEPLRPATPVDERERPAYLPRIPWRLVGAVTVVVAALIATYRWQDQQKADALRAGIVRVHRERLEPVAARLRAFRDRLEGWTVGAARAPSTEDFIDPALRISKLHGSRGIYLRVAREALEQGTFDEAVRRAAKDSLPACLGIAPLAARGLYDKSRVLEPSWLRSVERTDDVMTLRVNDEELVHHLRVELPALATFLDAEYFLFVLEGDDHRYEVRLRELRGGRELLRVSLRSDGELLTVRNALATGAASAPEAARVDSGAASDCLLASRLRVLADGPRGASDGETRAP